LFGLVKNEGLDLCDELKLQAKYGSEKAQSRREMENFCEAFGFTNIEDLPQKPKECKRNPLHKSKNPPIRVT